MCRRDLTKVRADDWSFMKQMGLHFFGLTDKDKDLYNLQKKKGCALSYVTPHVTNKDYINKVAKQGKIDEEHIYIY